MPRKAGVKQYNTFIKGLITEAGPLTYPEDAFLEGWNIVLNKDGSISRRLGIDYEDGYVKTSSGISGDALLETEKGFYKWNLSGKNSNIVLGIVRVKNKLYFLDMLAVSPSSSLKNSGNALTIAALENAPVEFSPALGGVVLVSGDLDKPIFLEYNSDTDVVSSSEIEIEVRDFWGVEDNLDLSTRPTTLSTLHKYNLYNQGWYYPTDPDNYIDEVKTDKGVYPSNTDIVSYGKKATNSFSPTYLFKNSLDRSPAPKGRFILNAFNRGTSRQTESGLSGLPLDKEIGRITSVSSFSGRIIYSGVYSKPDGTDTKSPNYSGFIFFTKTLNSKSDLGKCYQEADPTSEYISDIIDTDGGTISILEANKVIKTISFNNSLVVFSENGVWEVMGGDSGFKATDYQLNKITNIGVSNPKSIIIAGDTIIYWTKTGIYALSSDEVNGKLKAQNISLTTIQTFYNGLTSLAKDNAKGFYDQKENKVRWLYSQDTDDEYHKELVLDLTLQAFYPNTIIKDTVFIADYVEIPNYVNSASVEDVYVGNDLVVVDVDTVQVNSDIISNRDSSFSFLTFTNDGKFTLSKYSNDAFVDWEVELGGEDFDSYFITGYELFENIFNKKQATYLMMMMERTETGFEEVGGNLVALNPSSCLVQAQWNWTNSSASNKWGNPFQAYRYIRNYIPSGVGDDYDTGDRVIVTRNKLRGVGRSLSLYFQSEAGKDMKIIGWAIPVTQNGQL